MLETKRVAVVMRPVRPYCRGVLRGVASVSAQARWECILISGDGPPPVVDLAGFVHGLIGHFSEKVLLEHVDRARVPAVDISATEIRRRVRARLPIRYWVPDAVAEYVVRHRLYLDPE